LPVKLLLLNGPNLNRLGSRDPKLYGHRTLADIKAAFTARAAELGFAVLAFQSNHEGALIDFIQAESADAAGIIINPGALTHYGYSLRDALEDCRLPIIEVHLSDISQREPWRQHSVILDVCLDQVAGHGAESYIIGLEKLAAHLAEVSE
jgi:3-dehydroquinate dehydratase-2